MSMLGTFTTCIGPAILFIVHQLMADYSYQCTNEAQVQAFDFPTANFSPLINKYL
jgi:hypothetical protein